MKDFCVGKKRKKILLYSGFLFLLNWKRIPEICYLTAVKFLFFFSFYLMLEFLEIKNTFFFLFLTKAFKKWENIMHEAGNISPNGPTIMMSSFIYSFLQILKPFVTFLSAILQGRTFLFFFLSQMLHFNTDHWLMHDMYHILDSVSP